MNRTLNLGLSIAAGLLGGLISYSVSTVVHAQSPAPKEVTAEKFVLVNNQDIPLGVFGIDKDGHASITLFDKTGKVLWTEDGRANFHSLATNLSK